MTVTSSTLPNRKHYLNATYDLKSWLFTADHKRVGILYLISVSLLFGFGLMFTQLMQLELGTAELSHFYAETYNKFFTMHGVIMLFFFLIPAIPAILGNFLLPLTLGAKNTAMPKVGLLSLHLYLLGAVVLVGSFLMGGAETGWTFNIPYTTSFSTAQLPVLLLIGGILLVTLSFIAGALNFVMTVTKRPAGMAWGQLPLFAWELYIASIVTILAGLWFLLTMALLAAEIVMHIGLFDPTYGGSPLLFQKMFWFGAHPLVYITVLPAFGVIGDIFSNFSKKPLSGYEMIIKSSAAIAILSFFGWGAKMIISGQSLAYGLILSGLALLAVVPAVVLIVAFVGSLKGVPAGNAPVLYALGALVLFLMATVTDVILGAAAANILLADTYFEVGNFHYLFGGTVLMAFLGGVHYWFPKMFGRKYNNGWAVLSAAIVFVGANFTFLPQLVMGWTGLVRRSAAYPVQYQDWHLISGYGGMILALGLTLPLIYFLYALIKGDSAGDNPWDAEGLEWTMASPPPAIE